MQLSIGRFDISRSALLADAHRFGFESGEEAARYLDALLTRIVEAFDQVVHWLDPEWQEALRTRMRHNINLLGTSGLVDG
jgi:serine/threonine-protein kinase HipA